MRAGFIFLLNVLNVGNSLAQTNTAESILLRIQSLQVESDDFYDQGLFPSQRLWEPIQESVDDNNVFMTAETVFILRQIGYQDSSLNRITQSIIHKALPAFEKYKSRKGRPAYNFWQTVGADLPFPNGSTFISNERNRLPDDYDDSALVGLAKGNRQTAKEIHQEMIRYAVRDERKLVESYPQKYQSYRAYEVLYADKMRQEYDLVTMCNVLTFVISFNFELSQTDLETISLIRTVVTDGAHMQSPDKIAPYYPNTTLILYHLARIIAMDPGKHFTQIASIIHEDILAVWKESDSEFEKVLLGTSLIRLGEKMPGPIYSDSLEEELKAYPFFHFKPYQLQGILPEMTWVCEALNWTLLLEYLSLSGDRSLTIN